jgi:hypothetical protein
LEIIEASPLQPLYPLFSLVRSGGFLSFLLSRKEEFFSKRTKRHSFFSLCWQRRKEAKEKPKNVLAQRPAVGFPKHFTKLATLRHRSVFMFRKSHIL